MRVREACIPVENSRIYCFCPNNICPSYNVLINGKRYDFDIRGYIPDSYIINKENEIIPILTYEKEEYEDFYTYESLLEDSYLNTPLYCFFISMSDAKNFAEYLQEHQSIS